LKTSEKICGIVCTVKQSKCGTHSKKERRKVKIHEFLKDEFDPIGLRDVVNLTSDYAMS
jgi:hypothetical protein